LRWPAEPAAIVELKRIQAMHEWSHAQRAVAVSGRCVSSTGLMVARKDEALERVVSADGTLIAVWRSGEGPPLVLVHGTAADHSRWAPALPALEARFTVLAVDRRGRGESGDATDYALEREVEDVAAVVESAGDDVSLLGHSYGGVCSLEAALQTGRLRRLILYEPPLGFLASPPEVVSRLQALSASGDEDELVAYFMREVAGLPPEQVELMRSLPAWRARLAAAGTIPREERANREYAFDPARFRRLEVPTLFLVGGESPAAFGAAAEAVQSALPDCRTVVMPGQRHAAMDTGTDLFLNEVESFLE
jgi:pimeloyl-ACP methyl ester carboxylesterase